MILQALNYYYERLKDNPDLDIPILGFGKQNVHFVLVIDGAGRLLPPIRGLREKPKNKPVPIQLTVPIVGKKKASGIDPDFMWGNTGYVLGADNKGKLDRAGRQLVAFKELHHKLGNGVGDEGMIAVLHFLDSWNPAMVSNIEHWDEIAGKNVVFQLDGERNYIHDHPQIQKIWTQHYCDEGNNNIAICLVSGQRAPVAKLHPGIKGVGTVTAEGAVVSFNKKAFESYCKEQNFNAPIGKAQAFAYTTALNHLLRFGSRQKVKIGDVTTVFWAERESPVEGFMGIILDPRDDTGDVVSIRLFLEAVRDGKMPHNIGDPNVQFYILGLSPNAARISVRFWHVSTVGDISLKIGQHFKDLSMVKQYDNNPEFPSIRQILLETFINHNSTSKPNWDNLNPLLSGALMRSILTGAAYPQTLLAATIGRIRADQTINYLRAAIIKACLVRKRRINHLSEEVTMALDKDSTNIAYRLGRLFAVLEKAQMDAVPGANTTIKNRYYGSASATPRAVFPQLLRLAQHHIQKAEYGRRYDNMIEEIMEGIKEFPAHLRLEDQGMFAIGYYHQRPAFYTKSSDKKEAQS